MIYTRSIDENAALNISGAQSILPLVTPQQLPLSALRSHNTLRGGLVGDAAPASSDGVHLDLQPAPSEYGTYSPLSIAPYVTARSSAQVRGPSTTADEVAVSSYPWRVAGQLSFLIGSAEYLCSASMIKPGILVTAAHCVFQFGTNSPAGWHTNYVFVPAQYDPSKPGPYGTWTATSETIATSYYNGTDTCTTAGVVCNNDIAVVAMTPNSSGLLPGQVVGYYGYGWNGYSYTTSFGGATLSAITQLGYPVAFDSGLKQERTDGIGGYWTSGNLKNTVLGTAMTGGSSGGPWLVNFGTPPSVSSGASLGSAANPNVVVGVTSWGYTTVGTNTEGASWFGQNVEFPNASYTDSNGINRGAGNIGALVAAICSAYASSC